MPSSAQLRKRNEKFHSYVTKRGNVPVKSKDNKFPVGPVLLGFFLFVVVGSAILQIVRVQ